MTAHEKPTNPKHWFVEKINGITRTNYDMYNQYEFIRNVIRYFRSKHFKDAMQNPNVKSIIIEVEKKE